MVECAFQEVRFPPRRRTSCTQYYREIVVERTFLDRRTEERKFHGVVVEVMLRQLAGSEFSNLKTIIYYTPQSEDTAQ